MAEHLTKADLVNALEALNWEHIKSNPDQFQHKNPYALITAPSTTDTDPWSTNTLFNLRRAILQAIPQKQYERNQDIPTYQQLQALFEVFRKLPGFTPAEDTEEARKNGLDFPRFIIEEPEPGQFYAYSPDLVGCLAAGGTSIFDITDKIFSTMYDHMVESIFQFTIGPYVDHDTPPKEQQN